MQTDPIGYGGGMNFYVYTGDDPINFVDPLGLLPSLWEQCKPIPVSDYTPEEGEVVVNAKALRNCTYSGGGSLRGPFYARDPTIEPSGGGGVSGGGRGGGGGGGDQAEVRTRTSCALEAYNKNKFALGLDLAGTLVAIFLPEASLGSFVANSIIGVGGIGVAAANQDIIGSGIAWGGRHAAMSQSFGWGAVMSRISAGAVILSSARDLLNLKTDYDHCMAGN